MYDLISKKFTSTTNSVFNRISKDSFSNFGENIKSPKLNLKNHLLNSNTKSTKKLNFKNIKNYSTINYNKK
jgi:hypothetical protein